jgi:hypothetical protein
MDQPLETALLGTMALVDSGAQTDRTTTLPVDANCQTTPINPTIVNVYTQTTYEQVTTAVQTDSSNEECLHSLKAAEETAREEGYKRGKKEGFEAGVDVGLNMGEECGRSKERVEWNKYHGPDICVRTQVKKTNEATQTETPPADGVEHTNCHGGGAPRQQMFSSDEPNSPCHCKPAA